MEDRRAERIEQCVDIGAALLFAVAVAVAAGRLWPWPGPVAAGGLAGFGGCLALLRAVRPEPQIFGLAEFAVAELAFEIAHPTIEPEAPVAVQSDDEPDELLLEDALAEPDSDSRVVQLFDAQSMPTPAELRARIERHLGRGQETAVTPIAADATQALHEALDELRRSLR